MKKAVLVLAIAILPSIAAAGPITFNLRDPSIETIDEVNSFALTQEGLTATLTALPTIYNGFDLVLNQTLAAFGVNVVDTTCGSQEDSARLDGGCTGESIAIAFDADVLVNSLSVSSFGSLDVGTVLVGATLMTIQNTGTLSLGSLFLPAGEQMVVSYAAGNGFSLDNFTATPSLTLSASISVVEGSSTLSLLGVGLLGVALAGHSRRQVTTH